MNLMIFYNKYTKIPQIIFVMFYKLFYIEKNHVILFYDFLRGRKIKPLK